MSSSTSIQEISFWLISLRTIAAASLIALSLLRITWGANPSFQKRR